MMKEMSFDPNRMSFSEVDVSKPIEPKFVTCLFIDGRIFFKIADLLFISKRYCDSVCPTRVVKRIEDLSARGEDFSGHVVKVLDPDRHLSGAVWYATIDALRAYETISKGSRSHSYTGDNRLMWEIAEAGLQWLKETKIKETNQTGVLGDEVQVSSESKAAVPVLIAHSSEVTADPATELWSVLGMVSHSGFMYQCLCGTVDDWYGYSSGAYYSRFEEYEFARMLYSCVYHGDEIIENPVLAVARRFRSEGFCEKSENGEWVSVKDPDVLNFTDVVGARAEEMGVFWGTEQRARRIDVASRLLRAFSPKSDLHGFSYHG